MKYQVTQSFGIETYTEQIYDKTESFDNKKDAVEYFESIKYETQQGGCITTDFWELVEEPYNEFDVIDSYYSYPNYEDVYGKLVIAFQNTGKGMGYSHKFLDAFWLDKYNEKNISDNPDLRFKTWHTITDLTIDDLNGLTYDEAQEKVEKETRLKLENSIDLSNLSIIFAEEN